MPVDLASESMRCTGVPIKVKFLGSLSTTSLGTSSLAAAATNSPKQPLWLPLLSTPLLTVMLSAETFHCCAAAATSMARAVAPTLRISS